MNFTEIAKTRQSCRNFDPAREVEEEKLQAIDPVAYIRYVSVYRQFANVDEFIELIRRMERKSQNDPLQRKLSF